MKSPDQNNVNIRLEISVPTGVNISLDGEPFPLPPLPIFKLVNIGASYMSGATIPVRVCSTSNLGWICISFFYPPASSSYIPPSYVKAVVYPNGLAHQDATPPPCAILGTGSVNNTVWTWSGAQELYGADYNVAPGVAGNKIYLWVSNDGTNYVPDNQTYSFYGQMGTSGPCGSGSGSGSGSGYMLSSSELTESSQLLVVILDGPNAGRYTATPVAVRKWSTRIGSVVYEINSTDGTAFVLRCSSGSAVSTSSAFQPFSATFPGAIVGASHAVVVVARMMRPCHCDRFVPGRAYLEGTDCATCWLYAHRPTVREAWGGNPDDCTAVVPLNRDMPVAEMATLIAGPPLSVSQDWARWPVTHQAHLQLIERFLTDLPQYLEGRFAGRGVVIVGGGPYWPSAYVTVRMLRHVGCVLPVQVWYLGSSEGDDRYAELLAPFGAEVIDALAHPAAHLTRGLTGFPDPTRRSGPKHPPFEAKSFAVLHSPFEEVLYLDADCYPCADPSHLFDDPQYKATGAIYWPDLMFTREWTRWADWSVAPFGPECGLEVGQYVVHKKLAWEPLSLVRWYDDHGDWCYGWGEHHDHGDKGPHRIAWAQLRRAYAMFSTNAVWQFIAFLQPGPDGVTPMFVHRCRSKFSLKPTVYASTQQNGFNQRAGLPLEGAAFGYLEELRTTLVTISLLVIARNEEHRLAACVESARSVVDEVVIVVQESSDDTLALARQLADCVVEHPCHGTSEPSRTAGLEACTSEWVLNLDADESLTEHGRQYLRQWCGRNVDVLQLREVTYIDDHFIEDMPHNRLFRRDRVTPWVGLHRDWQPVSGARASVIGTEPVILHRKTAAEQHVDDARYAALSDFGPVRGNFDYLGVCVQQMQRTLPTFCAILADLRPSRVLEIGTGHGGFALFLRHALDALGLWQSPIVSLDPRVLPEHSRVRAAGVDIRCEAFVPERWASFVGSGGVSLVLCDSGDKPTDFRGAAPLLKASDVIMAHDYAPDREYFDTHFNGRTWNWFEISHADVVPIITAQSLEPWRAEQMLAVAWLSLRKQLTSEAS